MSSSLMALNTLYSLITLKFMSSALTSRIMPNCLLNIFNQKLDVHLKVNLSKTIFDVPPKLVPRLVVSISINDSSILRLAQPQTLESSLTLVFLSHLTFDLVANPVSSAFKGYAGSDYFSPPPPQTCPCPSLPIAFFMDHCNIS